MIKYSVSLNERLILNSPTIEIDPLKVYRWSVQASSKKSKHKSAYITIILLDENKKEKGRRHRFISNFNGNVQEYSIITAVPYTVPYRIKYFVLGYRINCEGAKASDVVIELPDIKIQKVDEVPNDTSESFDEVFSYDELFSRYNLEENYWTVVGSGKDSNSFHNKGKIKLDQLIKLGLKPNSTLLDIGCGTGILVPHLRNFLTSPRNYHGIDIVEKAIKYCRKKFPEFEFDLCKNTTLPVLNKKFDMICLLSVFTHMYPDDIIKYLIEMKKYLSPDGCIIATVRLNPTIPNYTGDTERMQHNKKFFIELVKKAGYSKILQMGPDRYDMQVHFTISNF